MSLLQSLRDLPGRYAAWQKQCEAEAELNAFSDRELADIGISRSDIADLIRQNVPSRAGQSSGDAEALKASPSAN